MAYFIPGNLKDGRLGPAVAPTTLTTALTVVEPLFFKSIVLSNTTASPITYIAHVVPPSTSASAATQVIPTISVPPNDMWVQEFGKDGIPVNAPTQGVQGGAGATLGDTIQHIASDAGLNYTMVFSRRNR